jgi:hypothetical protein
LFKLRGSVRAATGKTNFTAWDDLCPAGALELSPAFQRRGLSNRDTLCKGVRSAIVTTVEYGIAISLESAPLRGRRWAGINALILQFLDQTLEAIYGNGSFQKHHVLGSQIGT